MIPSPCVNMCKLDSSKHCMGCRRSTMEIASWQIFSDSEKLEVWEKIMRKFDLEGKILAKSVSTGQVKERVTLVLLDNGWVFRQIEILNQDGTSTSKGWEAMHRKEPILSIPEFIEWTKGFGYEQVPVE